MGRRSSGAVWMALMSRMPERERWSVRGMGVAVMVSTSDLGSHLFEALLVGDAEALLLVHDDESELLEGNVLLNESVGADDDIDLALRRGR